MRCENSAELLIGSAVRNLRAGDVTESIEDVDEVISYLQEKIRERKKISSDLEKLENGEVTENLNFMLEQLKVDPPTFSVYYSDQELSKTPNAHADFVLVRCTKLRRQVLHFLETELYKESAIMGLQQFPVFEDELKTIRFALKNSGLFEYDQHFIYYHTVREAITAALAGDATPLDALLRDNGQLQNLCVLEKIRLAYSGLLGMVQVFQRILDAAWSPDFVVKIMSAVNYFVYRQFGAQLLQCAARFVDPARMHAFQQTEVPADKQGIIDLWNKLNKAQHLQLLATNLQKQQEGDKFVYYPFYHYLELFKQVMKSINEGQIYLVVQDIELLFLQLAKNESVLISFDMKVAVFRFMLYFYLPKLDSLQLFACEQMLFHLYDYNMDGRPEAQNMFCTALAVGDSAPLFPSRQII